VHNESGDVLGGHTALDIDGPRNDGGPTSWQAAILTGEYSEDYMDNVGGAAVEAHREFYFEMSDFQHAYQKQAPADYVAADQFGIPNKFAASEVAKTEIIQPNPFNATVAFAPSIAEKWKEVVNPTLKTEAQTFPDVVTAKGGCPGPAGNFDPNVPRPCAEAINIAHSSTWVINYRNEPVGYRVFDPNETGPDGQNGAQAKGRAGDLALAFSSSINRAIPQLNTRFGDTPAGYQTGADAYCEGTGNGDLINCDRGSGDPFTPIMRVYEGDQTKVTVPASAARRTRAGATSSRTVSPSSSACRRRSTRHCARPARRSTTCTRRMRRGRACGSVPGASCVPTASRGATWFNCRITTSART
jgi:hypothetical protein